MNEHQASNQYAIGFLLIVSVLFLSFLCQNSLLTGKLYFIPGSIATIGLSTAVGCAATFASKQIDRSWMLHFGADLFFYAFLPFIVFNAGFHIKRAAFFRNWHLILVLALLGTWCCILLLAVSWYYISSLLSISPAFTWTESIAFSSLLASTDPVCTLAIFSVLQVDINMFYLVLGESVLNDAVALTIYREATSLMNLPVDASVLFLWVGKLLMLFILSACYGYFVGIIAAVLLRFFDLSSDKSSALCILLCLPPLSFLSSESMHGSGIVTVFFTGLSARRYVVPNVALDSNGVFAMGLCIESVGYGSEVAAMATMGLSMSLVPFASCSLSAVTLIVISCATIRLFQSYGLLSLTNLIMTLPTLVRADDYSTLQSTTSNSPITSEKQAPCSELALAQEARSPVPLKHMHMVWLSGLRGALNFSLAVQFPVHRDFVLSNTSLFILFTICVMGGCTGPFAHCLRIPKQQQQQQYSESISIQESDWESKFLDPWIIQGRVMDMRGSSALPVYSHSACCYHDASKQVVDSPRGTSTSPIHDSRARLGAQPTSPVVAADKDHHV